MKAKEATFLDLLGAPGARFAVPPFQRVYSWTARQCEDLLDDVMAAGAAGRPHFLGTFLYAQEPGGEGGGQVFQVIDGQQRITTVTLMILALAEHLERQGKAEAVQGAAWRERYLLAEDGASVRLQLTSLDADTLCDLLLSKEQRWEAQPEAMEADDDGEDDAASRLIDNLGLFRQAMEAPAFDGEVFQRGLEGLSVVAIALGPQDAPQEVFESLNSKGKRLAIEDLVRNAMGLDSLGDARGIRLYEERWLPIEDAVASQAGATMEDLLCTWIAIRHGDEHLDSKSQVYPLFKEDLAREFQGNWEALLQDLGSYAERFTADEQFRRDQLGEMDRWLQGKPKRSISEHPLFGD